ncbi:hypothetical protein [Mycobacteroides abscessus]|uniref:hypothetical protein n=1 Tax=Mycobacteroides abscessus TaxID=36809 RepID=UPI00092ADBC9|nr:hypothetical protein [Mycobacteroides abscessus]SIC19870.1 Uncharacterised protein [Mycobacteroides abscessus subsp. abscessus]
MMTLDKPQSSVVTAIRADLTDILVAAYRAIDHARNVSASFLTGNSDGAYAIGWDAAPIIDRAATTLANLVTVHELGGTWTTFWAQQPTPIRDLAGATLTTLHNDLRTSHRHLIGAAARAEALTHGDGTYTVYGWSIGWDLETAIDDVLIDIRTAARAAGLADHPYWVGVL